MLHPPVPVRMPKQGGQQRNTCEGSPTPAKGQKKQWFIRFKGHNSKLVMEKLHVKQKGEKGKRRWSKNGVQNRKQSAINAVFENPAMLTSCRDNGDIIVQCKPVLVHHYFLNQCGIVYFIKFCTKYVQRIHSSRPTSWYDTAQRHYEYSQTLMGVVLPLQQFQMIQQQHGLLAAVNCSPIPALLQWKNITNTQ